MDYLEFFSLSEDPYRLTPDPVFFYPSREHNEILSSLNYVVEQREGFFLATGEPGTGKTTILKVFIDKWKDNAEIALIMTPRLSPEEFLLAVIEDLNIPLITNSPLFRRKINKNEVLKLFRDFLVENSSAGKRIIIIVDEAQNLPDETLEELRLLSNLETEKEKLLQIILIGQPELRNRLLSDEMKQLNQRITMRAVLRPLSLDEMSDYINYRLVKAGKGTVIFEEKARKLLYRTSKGIPRLINLIASRAMMAAYLDSSRTVRKRHVEYATSHLLNENIRAGKWPRLLKKPMLAVLLVVLALFAALAAFGNRNLFMPAPETKSPVTAVQPKQETPVKVEIETGSQAPLKKTEKRIIVTAEAVNMREGPSVDSGVVTQAARGDSFEVADESADAGGRKWYKVKKANGKECWIAASAVREQD